MKRYCVHLLVFLLTSVRVHGEIPTYLREYLIETLGKVPDTSQEWREAGNGGYAYRFTIQKNLATSPIVMVSTSLECEGTLGYWRVARRDPDGIFRLLKSSIYCGTNPLTFGPSVSGATVDIFRRTRPQRDAAPKLAKLEDRTKFRITRYHIGEDDIELTDTYEDAEDEGLFDESNHLEHVECDLEAAKLDELMLNPSALWITLKPNRGDEGGPSNYTVHEGYIIPRNEIMAHPQKGFIPPTALVTALKTLAIQGSSYSTENPSVQSPKSMALPPSKEWNQNAEILKGDRLSFEPPSIWAVLGAAALGLLLLLWRRSK